MGRYQARHLLLLPNLLSLLRVPLALAFFAYRSAPAIALLVLIVAGVSDVFDGWYARRRRQATPTGAVVDPITDKLFVGVVVVTLLADGRLTWWMALMLAARDLGELPLVIGWGLSRERRRARSDQPTANVPGKVATALQFATVASALFAQAHTAGLAIASGVAGVLAAASYWRRELNARPGRSRS